MLRLVGERGVWALLGGWCGALLDVYVNVYEEASGGVGVYNLLCALPCVLTCGGSVYDLRL